VNEPEYGRVSRPGAAGTTGVVIGQIGLTVEEIRTRGALAEKHGADDLWLVQMPNQRDSSALLAGIGAATTTAGLGPAVLPIYTRPPVAMAHHAITLDEVFDQRLILGLGLGHRQLGDWMVGTRSGPPVESMRDYLTIVASLVRDGEVNYSGEWFSGHASYSGPRRADLPIFLGSFGPKMIQLAGELADGLLLYMCGIDYLREQVMPNLRIGRQRRGLDLAGYPVVLMLPAAVYEDRDEAVQGMREHIRPYLRVPTYRRMFETSGFGACTRAGEASDDMIRQVTAVGSAGDVARHLQECWELGVTQVAVAPVHDAHKHRDRFMETVDAAVHAAA
jgi:alkanesulfonate monooxygenase SsuD/methylene tetrahydromethanopterin reductase-like flavin-dependent oxidoreductase (luciferase family)